MVGAASGGGASYGPALRWPLVVTILAVLSVAHTWPLAADLGGQLQAGADPKSMMSSLADLARNLLDSPGRLMDGSFFYPYRHTLATLDHQIANALLLAPAAAAGAGGATLYNLAVLASFLLSGVFTYALARHLGATDLGALLAACAFAFGGARVASLEHVHVLSTQWLPLALLTLHRYLELPVLRRWLALTLATLLVALTSWHMAIIGAVGIAIVSLFALAGEPQANARRVIGLAAAGAVSAIVLLPLARIYAQVSAQWPQVFEDSQEWSRVTRSNSADLHDLLWLPVESRNAYASLLASEGPALFPGLVTLVLMLLAAITLFRLRSRSSSPGRWALRGYLWLSFAMVGGAVYAAFTGGHEDAVVLSLRPVAPFVLLAAGLLIAGLAMARRTRLQSRSETALCTYAALAVGGLLLALGPTVHMGEVDLGSGLWRLDLLPVPVPMRAPARLAMLMSLGLAVTAGLGASSLARRWQRPAPWIAVLVLLNVDLAFSAGPFVAVPQASGVDRWLAESSEAGAVLEYPLPLHGHYWGLYASQELYRRPNVSGLGLVAPPEIRRLLARDDFSAAQIDILLESLHPRFLVVRSDVYPADEWVAVRQAIADRGRMLQERARDGDDYVYELIDRTSGRRIERRWPSSVLLAGPDRLVFSADLSEGRSGTIGELVVLFNGNELARIADAGTRPEYEVPFDRADVAVGINTFELRGAYRLPPEATGHAVGDSGVSLRADLEVTAGAASAAITLNGQSLDLPGVVLLAALDPASGEVVAAVGLDGEEEDWPARLQDFVAGLREGAVVAAAMSADAALPEAAAAAVGRLGMHGARPPGVAYAAVAVAGIGVAIEHAEDASVAIVIGEPAPRRVQLRRLELR